MPTLYLIRGLPGSGKSTLAATIAAATGARHFEADQVFVTDAGEYVFDASKLGYAHSVCFSQTKLALECGHDAIVANTFSRQWELNNYIDLAYALGAKVFILTCENNFGNVHNVPHSVISQMAKRWEPAP